MASHSRNERGFSGASHRRFRSKQEYEDALLDRAVPRTSHPFKIFRLGWDACAKCGKPRAEHS